MLERMSTEWKRSVLNLHRIVLGPPGRLGSCCSVAPTGSAIAAIHDLGMPERWWDNERFTISVEGGQTCTYIFAKDAAEWGDFLILTLGMNEEEACWFNTTVLLGE